MPSGMEFKEFSGLGSDARSIFFFDNKTEKSQFKNEKALCDFACDRINDFIGLVTDAPIAKIHREYCIGGYQLGGNVRQHSRARIDICLEHSDKSLTLIEAKIPKIGVDLVGAVAQLIYYRTLLKAKHSVQMDKIRLVILTDKIDWSVMATIKDCGLDVSCVGAHPSFGWLLGRV